MQRLDIIRVLRFLPEDLQRSSPVQTAVEAYAALGRTDFAAYLRLYASAGRSRNERLLLAHRLGQVSVHTTLACTMFLLYRIIWCTMH